MDYFKISRFFLIASLFTVVIVAGSTLFPFVVGKYVFFRTVVGLAFVFFLLGTLFSREGEEVLKRAKKVLKEPLVIAVSVFLLVFLLAGFLGVDPHFSFWSSFERGEGGLQMIFFYVFFFLLITLFKDEKEWRKLLGYIVLGGAIMVLYGFLNQEFGSEGFRFSGSIGNPAYTAAYVLFLLFFIFYLLGGEKRRNLKKGYPLVLLATSLLFLAAFVLAATRGAFIGFIVAAVAALGYLAFSDKRLRKIFIAAALLLVILYSLGAYFYENPFVQNLPASRIFDISATTETFYHRTIMWNIAWEGFKEKPVLGWGPENFLHVFEKHFDERYFSPGDGYGAWFDRAHSVYFDYLVSTGILGLLSFLGIFVVFFIRFFKTAGKRSVIQNAVLFALPVAYLVQGIVLFDVLVIYLALFFFLAFAGYKFIEAGEKEGFLGKIKKML